MKARSIKFMICIVLGLIVVTFTIVKNVESKKTIPTSGTVQTFSNKKIGWGIKRADNHERPDVGARNKQLLEQFDGICIGNEQTKCVYLTFDEGYEAGNTSKILEVLKANEVRAAFFITGYYLNKETDLVKRMIEDGHIIGNHAARHLMSGKYKV